MNREIKFRGFSKELNSWVYGFLQEVDVEGVGYSYIFWQGNTTFVEANSVGQFTNLYDKNEKEIYEGDIVKYKNYNGFSVIRYEKGSFFFYGISVIHFLFNVKEKDIEIIGNIYENPEFTQSSE